MDNGTKNLKRLIKIVKSFLSLDNGQAGIERSFFFNHNTSFTEDKSRL